MTEQKYGAEQIQILDGLAHVRKRPGMYIGSTGPEGLQHLIYEVVDNSIDESLAGFCDLVLITVGEDERGQWCRVVDNGRGIPIANKKLPNGQEIPAVQACMTIIGAGGKFGGGGYKVSGGLHGVGISVVNALSNHVEIAIQRDGKLYTQEYNNGGVPKSPKITKAKDKTTGTTVLFYPDTEVFQDIKIAADTLKRRFRQTSFLTPKVRLTFVDERVEIPTTQEFYSENGLADYVSYLTTHDVPLVGGKSKIIVVDGESNEVKVDVAVTYTKSYNEKVYCFANNIYNPEGGTHNSGFRKALTKAINGYAQSAGLFKKNEENLTGEDLREGLVAVISVKLAEPQFEGQTKMKLGSPHVAGAVETVVYEQLKEGFEKNPALAKAIIQKCIDARKARIAAKKVRELTRKKATGLDNPLVGKLSSATSKNPAEKELFVVEGDSAGGSAKQARDKHFQAILPLKGKPINIEKATEARAFDNEEVRAIVQALGTGIGKNYDSENLQYDKLIIMADADVDGQHIICLLLTFLYRLMPRLISDGHVWISLPPLFQVKWKKGDKKEYLYSSEEKTQCVKGKSIDSYEVSRFKGLGEMSPTELSETAMDPGSRKIVRVAIADAEEADQVINDLMGNNSGPRKEFIMQANADNLLE